MTVHEAIARVDDLKPNQYDRRVKVGWLSTLDGLLVREVIAGHEGTCEAALAFDGYRLEKDDEDGRDVLDMVLLVPEPYTEVYDHYLMAQIDYLNGEMDHYNNAMVMYNMALSRYADWYNRTHMPRQDHYVRMSL